MIKNTTIIVTSVEDFKEILDRIALEKQDYVLSIRNEYDYVEGWFEVVDKNHIKGFTPLTIITDGVSTCDLSDTTIEIDAVNDWVLRKLSSFIIDFK